MTVCTKLTLMGSGFAGYLCFFLYFTLSFDKILELLDNFLDSRLE